MKLDLEYGDLFEIFLRKDFFLDFINFQKEFVRLVIENFYKKELKERQLD